MQHPHAAENYCRTFTPVNKLYFLRRASPRGKQSEHQTINDTRNTIKDFFVHADSAFLKGEIYVCHNSGKYLNRYFKQLRPGRNIRNSQNHKTNSGADWKAWENLIGRGDDDTAEKWEAYNEKVSAKAFRDLQLDSILTEIRNECMEQKITPEECAKLFQQRAELYVNE